MTGILASPGGNCYQPANPKAWVALFRQAEGLFPLVPTQSDTQMVTSFEAQRNNPDFSF
jgi:hypothetical protein